MHFVLYSMVLLLLIGLAQIDKSQYVHSTITSKFVVFLYCSLVIFGAFIVYIISSDNKKIQISKLDIALTTFIIYVTINRYVFQNQVGFSIRYIELIGLSFLYVVLRNFSTKHFLWFILAIIISGSIQAVYGNLQLLGYYASNHSGFKMTGSFFNPGPYAGFLASVWPLAFGMYLFKEDIIIQIQSNSKKTSNLIETFLKTIFEYVPLVGVVSILLVIPASQSRASWLAILISSGILLELKYRIVKKTVHRVDKYKKSLLVVISVFILSAGLFGIYQFKKGSSDGRLFIWKVTTEMIKDAPVFGVGFDSFKANYMNYQAKYFAENGETAEALVADNTYYSFNEFLQLFAENGIIGIILLVIICLALFKIRVKKENINYLNMCKVGLLAIAVFASFSYPLQILPIKLILVALLAFVASINSTNLEFFPSKNMFGLIKTITFLMGVFIIVNGVKYTSKLDYGFEIWQNALISYKYGDYEGAIEEYKSVYPVFEKNGEFLMNYGKTLSMEKKHTQAIEILERAKLFLNTTIIETALGDSYKALKQYDKSEIAYQHAANMIPSRFYPNYLLAKLYNESEQKEKAIKKAQELLSKKVKIPSTAIKEIHVEMKNLIESYE